MVAVAWSNNLQSVVANLKKMNPQEIESRLKDVSFIQSLGLTSHEKQAVTNVFAKSDKVSKSDVEDGTWA